MFVCVQCVEISVLAHIEDEIIKTSARVCAALSNRASPFALYAVLHVAYHIKVVCINYSTDLAGAVKNSHATDEFF